MQQKILFFTGIDSDSANEGNRERLGEAFCRSRLNVRVLNTDSGNNGAAETVNGNLLVSFTLPTGSNTVIGSFEYELDKKNYYFVYNSLLNHSILLQIIL